MKYKQIATELGLPWLELDIDIPHEDMLQEAIGLKEEFVKHRDQDNGGGGGYRHKGWRSLCIHGIDPTKTNHFTQYGYNSHEETPYDWTEICARCPITHEFFKYYFCAITEDELVYDEKYAHDCVFLGQGHHRLQMQEFKKELQSYIFNNETNTLSNNIGTLSVDPVETIPSSLEAALS